MKRGGIAVIVHRTLENDRLALTAERSVSSENQLQV